MYITIDNPTRELRSKHTNGELVEFAESGTAQVPTEIGEQLVKQYDDITEK